MARAYGHLTRMLAVNTELDRLRSATRLVVGAIGAGSCGITLELDGYVVPVVGSDARAVEVDRVQFTAAAGPGVEALRTGIAVPVPDLTAETRWPDFRRQALATGLRSSLSMPLCMDGRPVGVLSAYAESVAAFPPDRQRVIEVFAGAAARSLPAAVRFARDLQPAPHPPARSSRAVVEQALRFLVREKHCPGPYEAFDRLCAESRRQDVPLSVVAADLLAGAGPPPRG